MTGDDMAPEEPRKKGEDTVLYQSTPGDTQSHGNQTVRTRNTGAHDVLSLLVFQNCVCLHIAG